MGTVEGRQVTYLEQRAIEFGSKPANVKRRLLEALRALDSGLRKALGNYAYDPTTKRLLWPSAYLEWRIRPQPDEPISYENQQTINGIVVLTIRGDK